MTSLDVEYLFTNTPLEETIHVWCDFLFSNNAKVNNINRIDFETLLRAALKNTFSILNKKFINKLMELLWDLL